MHGLTNSCFNDLKKETLHLDSTNVNGTIPDFNDNLTSLTVFDVSDAKMKGAIPETIGKLINLNDIDFSTTNIVGTIPKSMTNVTQLQRFACINCGLNESLLTIFIKLSKSIQSINLHNNYIHGIIPNFIIN